MKVTRWILFMTLIIAFVVLVTLIINPHYFDTIEEEETDELSLGEETVTQEDLDEAYDDYLEAAGLKTEGLEGDISDSE